MTKQVYIEHTGEILKSEFLDPMNITAYKLAQETGVSKQALSQIINGKRSVTAEVSLLLDKYFGLSDGFFHRLQQDYDMRMARRKMTEKLAAVIPYQGATENRPTA